MEGAGCSNILNAPKTISVTSDSTANVLQEMAFVGGMNYARTRLLGDTDPKASGKRKKVRTPILVPQRQQQVRILPRFRHHPHPKRR